MICYSFPANGDVGPTPRIQQFVSRTTGASLGASIAYHGTTKANFQGINDSISAQSGVLCGMDSEPRSTMKKDIEALAVRTNGLGKRFGKQWALAHCDLEVQQGQTILLAGANGSGKTTLLRLLAGLYKPTQGDLQIFGHDPEKERMTCRSMLTLVGHDHYLYSQLTALETVQTWARLAGHDPAIKHLQELLDEVNLGHRKNNRVGGFSAGMKKRLTLLRTRLEEPRLVLLDEPFSALDTAGQQLIEDWVAGYREAGRTVLVASHNLPRAARLCDRAVYLKDGQIIWQGSSSEMVQQMGLA